jgi:hypothetical protein
VSRLGTRLSRLFLGPQASFRNDRRAWLYVAFILAVLGALTFFRFYADH